MCVSVRVCVCNSPNPALTCTCCSLYQRVFVWGRALVLNALANAKGIQRCNGVGTGRSQQHWVHRVTHRQCAHERMHVRVLVCSRSDELAVAVGVALP